MTSNKKQVTQNDINQLSNGIEIATELLEKFSTENSKLKEENIGLEYIVENSKQTLFTAKQMYDNEVSQRKKMEHQLKCVSESKANECKSLDKYIKQFSSGVSQTRKQEILKMKSNEWNEYIKKNVQIFSNDKV